MSGKKKTMTYRELYNWALYTLESRFEAEQLYYHILQKKVFDLPYCGEQDVAQPLREKLIQSIDQRKTGVPLQYLLGEWEFYGLPFQVGEGVLIPRADTETLVDVGRNLLVRCKQPVILDLCSGSGCVAIALAKNIADARVTALEISEQALVYLRKNVQKNGVSILVEKGDVLGYTHTEPAHLIVSNPPYIPHAEIESLQTEVQYEPRRALDGGDDGLDFYRVIIHRYFNQLHLGGWLCLEVGIHQSESVAALFYANGYTSIQVQNDLCGVPRVVYGQRPDSDQKG